MAKSEGDVWPNGARFAVSLAYDGGHSTHLSSAIPVLDSMGVHATFFLSPSRLLDDPLAWQVVAKSDHEIGNHSLYGVTDHGALLNWTLAMVEADVRMTQELIRQVLGVEPQSFALGGWSTLCAEGDYLPLICRMFPFVRSVRREVNAWSDCELDYLGSFSSADQPISHLMHAAETAAFEGAWAILAIDRLGIDGVRETDHETLLGRLSEMPGIWLAPVGAVSRRIQELQAAAALESR